MQLKMMSLWMLTLVASFAADAQEKSDTFIEREENDSVDSTQLFLQLVGKWEGTCKTWFEPGKLADESRITGEFEKVFNDTFLRHRYRGQIQGKPRQGEELLAFNAITKSFEVVWIDDFHMSYAIMVSRGEATPRGLQVRGEYDVAENQPRWGWRTKYELVDDNQLTIMAYNVAPDGTEDKAVETTYQRVP